MASILSKAPLFESPSTPGTPGQWKLALQEIKALYVKRQYKQCAARSFEILRKANPPLHPVYKTYLLFYSAISYEGMARGAHVYSSKKIPLFQSALDCFFTCNTALPSTISTIENHSNASSPESSFTDISFSSAGSDHSTPGSLVSSITDIIDRSIDSPGEDPFISDTETGESSVLDTPSKPPRDGCRPGLLMPSPLKTHKPLKPLVLASQTPSNSNLASPMGVPSPASRAQLPPPLPLRIVPSRTSSQYHRSPASRTATTPSAPRSSVGTPRSLLVSIPENTNTTPNPSPATAAVTTSIHRYNASVQYLRSQIQHSIAHIHDLMDDAKSKQAARRASHMKRSVSFWSFSPVKKDSPRDPPVYEGRRAPAMETKEQRIARLRAEGWRTVGLKSAKRGWKGTEYYQAYCGSVLEELDVDA